MLGFNDISEATVSRYLRKYHSKHPDKKKQQSWMTFLRNYNLLKKNTEATSYPVERKQLLLYTTAPFFIKHSRCFLIWALSPNLK